MDELIKAKMEDGESILWQGGPESIRTLDKTNKKRFFITTIICLLTAVVLLFLYVTNVKGDLKPSVFVIILGMCACAPLRRLLGAAKIRKLRYVVTDKRLMIVSDEVKAVPYSRIRIAAFRSDPDNHLSFLAGERALKAAPSHWRDMALTGQSETPEPGEPVEAFAFYAVEDKAGLREAIHRVLPDVQE